MGGKHNQGKIVQCKNCNKEHYIPPYRIPNYKFCSRTCAYQWKSKNETVIKNCLVCNSSFNVISNREKTAKYCSNQCRYKAMNGRGSIKYTCQHCHKDFYDSPSHKRKYCSKSCVNKSSKTTFKPTFATVRKSMIRRNLINKCEKCGFDSVPEILGIHHKDRNRKNNDISNLQVLCPNCHSIEHHKHIPH